MEYLVLADFKTNPGMADDMAAVFKEALVETRAFDGCNAIDVYFEEKTSTFTLVEDWQSLEHYEKYLQWRIDGGIAELLNPILDGGWDSVVNSVKRLGKAQAI
jgi:quinol monooxygenase YgiN